MSGMTILEWAHTHLTDGGLWPEEAVAILDSIHQDGGDHARLLASTMDKDMEGYPAVLIATVRACVDVAAADWLRENKPAHFALPVFAGRKPWL